MLRVYMLHIHKDICLGIFVPQEYQQVVDAEWTILYDKLNHLVKSGAKVVLSKLPIGDVATQYFADRWVSRILLKDAVACTNDHTS